MRTKAISRITLAVAVLSIVAGATEVRAAACSPSISSSISRSTGGECISALSADEIITLTYRVRNQSVIDVPMGAFVDGKINDLEEFLGVLAQSGSSEGDPELPGVLEFIPVCPVGSSQNVGLACANDAFCGTGKCGCVSSEPGVTCVANGANKIKLVFGQEVPLGPNELKDIATIQVKSVGTVNSVCGVYATFIDSGSSFFSLDDTDCDSQTTAGAQASADLHAPECTSNADCGNTVCRVCADLGTNGDPSCEDAPDATTCETDSIGCTGDQCAAGECVHTPSNLACDDASSCTTEVCNPQSRPGTGCVYTDICQETNICRSPGYWATHSGCQKEGSINVGQLVIDAVGPLEVCGEAISTTSDCESPFVDGLGLTSNLEGLCVRVKGVKERQLYRQLMAAALNCGITGGDCDTITGPLLDVSYDDCNNLCAGNPVVDGPTINECISQLDCFNNGGEMIDDACVYDLPGNCHEAALCNEEISVCPKQTPASSSGACKEARANDCTIDECN